MFDDIITTLEICKSDLESANGESSERLSRINAAISKLETMQRYIEDLITASDDILEMMNTIQAAAVRFNR